MQMINPKLIKITGSDVLTHAIDFIHYQMEGLALGAQMRHQSLVARVQTGAAIHQQQDHVRLGDGCHRLARHCRIDTLFLSRDATGINDDKGCFLQPPLPVLSIAGQTRQIGDQGVPTAGQLVKESGFADIGTAHQGEHGQHDVSFALRRRRLSRHRRWCRQTAGCPARSCRLARPLNRLWCGRRFPRRPATASAGIPRNQLLPRSC